MRRRRADRSQARQEPVLGMDQTLAAIRDQIKPRLDDPAEFRFILDRSVRRLMRVGYSSPMARLFVDACVEAARREKAKEDSRRRA